MNSEVNLSVNTEVCWEGTLRCVGKGMNTVMCLDGCEH